MKKYLYLNVPYSKKEYAKSIGCKWDSTIKSWYAPDECIKNLWYKTNDLANKMSKLK